MAIPSSSSSRANCASASLRIVPNVGTFWWCEVAVVRQSDRERRDTLRVSLNDWRTSLFEKSYARTANSMNAPIWVSGSTYRLNAPNPSDCAFAINRRDELSGKSGTTSIDPIATARSWRFFTAMPPLYMSSNSFKAVKITTAFTINKLYGS